MLQYIFKFQHSVDSQGIFKNEKKSSLLEMRVSSYNLQRNEKKNWSNKKQVIRNNTVVYKRSDVFGI